MPDNTSNRIVNYSDVNGKSRPFFLIATRHTDNILGEVLVDNDFLHGFITYRRLNPSHIVTARELSSLLQQASIVVGVDNVALELLAELVNADRPPPGPFAVARGELPQPGEAGHIEFHVQPTTSEARYDTAQDGTIDYRELNLLENCFKGQLIATLHPPGIGRNGRDIHGRPIKPIPGSRMNVLPGTGVAVSPDGREFTAEISGRVGMEKGRIYVSQDYEVAGDVDYRVGNIDFVGRVTVKGAVLDGFRVAGKMGVKVLGHCGACEIESEGDVVLVGGIKGRRAAIIHSGGSVQARYLDECIVEAKGDVVVEREIVNSTVRTTGRLLIGGGSVMGGEAVALRGALVGVAGSTLGIATRIAVGINWTDEATLAELDAAIADAAGRAKTAQQLLNPFLEDTEAIKHLTIDEKNTIPDLIAELARLKAELSDLLAEREAVQSRKREDNIPLISVRKRIFPGTLINFPTVPHRVMEVMKGPLSLTCTDPRSPVKTIPFQELPDPTPLPGQDSTPPPTTDDSSDFSEDPIL